MKKKIIPPDHDASSHQECSNDYLMDDGYDSCPESGDFDDLDGEDDGSECSQLADGSCGAAGSEYCEFECPFRHSKGEDEEDPSERYFQPCGECDGHDACADFGCAIENGLEHLLPPTI